MENCTVADATPELKTDIISARAEVYGPEGEGHKNIAKCWEGILSAHNGFEVTVSPDTVALMMAALKLVRSARVYHEDNYVDAENYIGFAKKLRRQDSTKSYGGAS